MVHAVSKATAAAVATTILVASLVAMPAPDAQASSSPSRIERTVAAAP